MQVNYVGNSFEYILDFAYILTKIWILSYVIFHLLKLCDRSFCSQRNKQGQGVCV